MICSLELLSPSWSFSTKCPQQLLPIKLVLAGELKPICYAWYNVTSEVTDGTAGSLIGKCPVEVIAFLFNSRHPQSFLLQLLICEELHYSLLPVSKYFSKGRMSNM